MDKETLSNYGWIVICVLVMVVMIALATPFGSFISEAVQSTTKGLFDVNKSALDSTGLINIDNQEFDVPDMNHGAENGGNTGETPVVPEEPVLKEGYLSGTWRFNDVLLDSENDISEGVYFFTESVGSTWQAHTFETHKYGNIMEVSFIGKMFGGLGDSYNPLTTYSSDGWNLDTYKTITFGEYGNESEQQVSMGFWNWFTANATRIG